MSKQDLPGFNPVLSGELDSHFLCDMKDGLPLPGMALTATCPHCGCAVTNFLDEITVWKPVVNEPAVIHMYCDGNGKDDEGCGDNFTVKIKLNFSVELA